MTKIKIATGLVYGFLSSILAVVIVLVVFAVGIYKLNWTGGAVEKFVSVVPFPVAMVGKSFVTYNELNHRQELYNNLVKEGVQVNSPEHDSLLLEQLIKEEIVKELLERKNIQITKLSLDRYYEYVIENFDYSEKQKLDDALKRADISNQDFKYSLIKSAMERDALTVAILEDNDASAEYLKARNILDELRSGASFEDVAVSASEDDETSYIGGDMGYRRVVEINPWLAEKAITMKTGDISNIIAAPDGYHIIQVASKDKAQTPEYIQLRHILIKSNDSEQVINDQSQDVRIAIMKSF